MLRNLSVIALFVFVTLFTFGTQNRSSAQLAYSNSWALPSNAPMLIFNIQGAPDFLNGGYTGYFSVSNSNFTCLGSVTNIINSMDTAGNMYSVTFASGVYYTVVNGVQSPKGTAARFVVSMRKMADGAQWEGFTAYNASTGMAMFTTGNTRDGSPYVLPLKRGTITLSM